MSFFNKLKGGESSSKTAPPEDKDNQSSWFSSVSSKFGGGSDDSKSSYKSTKAVDKGEKRRQAWRQSDKDLWADEEDDVEDPKLKQYYKYKKDRAKERDANENSIFTQVQRAFNERGEVLTQVEEQFHNMASNASKMAGEAQNTAAKGLSHLCICFG